MYTIYHNPRCNKSRKTLNMLRENGIEPDIRLYLQDPPTIDELHELESYLGMPLIEFVRKQEAAYKQHQPLPEELPALVAAHPILLERPIVVKRKQAVIGRPPEQVLELIK